ncbi:hypothetical protein GP2_042_00180 [Gordonia paraffinivorans NBRC 108238]|uniref:Zinc-ribbon 15 domain-containing protein n=1 Tax=Gordonia paraffinivorans NBRC 108238 TaxID=1223543 RepID=A0ABQ0IQF4_9ACTN|nr:zinc-ribbon domain-containing protein [Gordonia paraffinivorans]GAC85792.1 hypothetical protein GP2_042_00180 [Gordonia paraffinivorans NBRC 108238]
MIIFGSRTMVKLVAAQIFMCMYCRVEAAQRLFRSTTWFTLFFLPIFPFGHGTYRMSCSYCGNETILPRPEADRFTADAQRTAAAASPAVPPQV